MIAIHISFSRHGTFSVNEELISALQERIFTFVHKIVVLTLSECTALSECAGCAKWGSPFSIYALWGAPHF